MSEPVGLANQKRSVEVNPACRCAWGSPQGAGHGRVCYVFPHPMAFRALFSRSGARAGLRMRATLHTISLAGVVVAMGYAGAVQNNGVAYLLCFTTLVLAAMSWLRARENLRGIELSVGRLSGGRAGENSQVPLEIRAPTGQGASGLEIMDAEGKHWSYVETVPPGGSRTLTIPIAARAGVQNRLRVLVRSSYPMGLFSAERLVEVATHRRIHPKPEGDLPLPAPDRHVSGEVLSHLPAAGRPGREGDDFAGLREWHPGDSLRHVDWRAVARGRPLLVKQWASGSSQALTLDWEKLPLPEEARAGQIAQWIEQAESSDLPYALQLPGRAEIGPGFGPAHASQCLDALAEFWAPPPDSVETSPHRLPAGYERSAHLPPWPLLVLCSVLLVAALLLLDLVPTVAVALFAGCVVWRLAFAEAGWKARRASPRLAMAANSVFSIASLGVLLVGLAAVQVSTGNLMSMEGGIAVLLVLLGAKLLESRTPHDFQVLAMVGWFLCLCCLLSSQMLSRSLWTFAVFAGIAVCMVRFRRGAEGWAGSLRLSAVMLAQALPVAVLLFFLFPRSSLNFLERIGTQNTHVTGISSSLQPGRISQIATSDEVAFRVEFPEAEPPAHASRYWRCLVLWQCEDGLTWQRGDSQQGVPRLRLRRRSDTQQVITLEPHGQLWLPALDLPIQGIDEGRRILPDLDEAMTSPEPVKNLRRFEVYSRLSQESGEITPAQRQAALRLPANLSPRVRELARKFQTEAGGKDVTTAQVAVRHLQEQRFEYSLEPGVYEGPSGLDQFIFDRKVGFCEHFSAAFATLMRAAGVPARIVIGYMGGEWSERGGYMIVRQSDAHAWTELWLEGQGWTRVDPTAALVPERVTLDLRTLLAGGEAELQRQRGSLLWQVVTTARLWWDSIEYDWYNGVIAFDEEAQIAWMNWLGLGRLRGHWLMLLSGLTLAAALLALGGWLRRVAPVRDPWQREWLKACRRLEQQGAPPRLPTEGPLHYAQKVAKARPELAEAVHALASNYITGRYGPPMS